uniref:Uncharacterized protein n=1 Tax=Opuntia streptacantha TaxID=393608 RepID=A0A7C9DPT5_OPUST
MLVSTDLVSTFSPEISFNPSASILAFLWSSSSFLTLSCNATKAAAHKIPTCLIPPPKVFLSLFAFAIKLFEPTMTDPTGAPRPFDRQTDTESAACTNLSTGTPRAVAALKMRAPSI